MDGLDIGSISARKKVTNALDNIQQHLSSHRIRKSKNKLVKAKRCPQLLIIKIRNRVKVRGVFKIFFADLEAHRLAEDVGPYWKVTCHFTAKSYIWGLIERSLKFRPPQY